MSASPASRRAVAEIDFSEGQGALFKIGNRSIHQFWHLFSSHFRHVLLAPQRRPDSGRVAWTWRESTEKRPVTTIELAEVRRRLTEAGRSLAGGFGGLDRDDDNPGGAATLEGQVRASVEEMVGQLVAQRDSALNAFVCRTDAGLMVHSWGAAVAAQPYYPDAQHGEVSGTVFAGAGRLAGANVVLENAQGMGVARVKSESDGGFRFPGVGPGHYRVRVLDRSDFPGVGLAVTMERESITGLELRGISTEAGFPNAGPPLPTGEATPWYKRRWTAVVALLLVLGVGSCVWHSTHSPAAQTTAESPSSGWQSASGQVADANAKNPSQDDRKVGTEGAFSSLSNTLPPPKTLTPSHSRNPSEKTGRDQGRFPSQPEDSATAGEHPEGGKKLAADSTMKTDPAIAGPQRAKPSESKPSSSGSPAENSQPAEELGAIDNGGDEAKPAADKLAKSLRAANEKKRPAVSGASAATTDELSTEAPASTGLESSVDSPPSASAATAGAGSKKVVAAKGANAPGKSTVSPETGGDEDTGAQDSTRSSTSGPSVGQLKSNPGVQRPQAAQGSVAGATSEVPVQSTNAPASTDTPDESRALEAASAGKTSPSSLKPKKKSAEQMTPQPGTGEQSPGENSGEEATPAVASSSKKPAKPSPTNTGKTATVTAAASGSTSSAAETESPVTDQSAALTRDTARAANPKQSKKQGASSSPQPDEEKPAAESSANLAPVVPTESSPKPIVDDEQPLVQIGKIRASSWKPRMIQDLIMPTRPVTAAEEEALDAMREKLLQERAGRMPKTFQQRQTRRGFTFEFASAKASPPRWKDASGAEPVGSTVHGRSAELSWIDTTAQQNDSYTLSYADGQQIARVIVDQTGALILKTTPGVRAWYWVGVELARADATNSSVGQTESGFDWRLSSGEPVPSSWSHDEHWLEGRGQRINIPLDETTRRVGNYGIALVDRATGWGLMSDVVVQAP